MKKTLLLIAIFTPFLFSCGEETPVVDTPPVDSVAVEDSVPEEAFKLGEATYVAMGTKDLQASVAFYQKLGFEVKQEETIPYPWVYMSDGSFMIGIFQDSMEYQGPAYYTNDYDGTIEAIKAAGGVYEMSNEVEGMKMSVYATPDSTLSIGIITPKDPAMYQPEGATLMDVVKAGNMDPAAWPNPKIGAFGEYSYTTKDLDGNIAFWEQLGFTTLNKSEYEGFEYAILTDGMQVLGIHKFRDKDFNAVTYFSPDTKEKMAALNAEGIQQEPTDDPMMGDSNFILATPEGFQFFLFNLPSLDMIPQ